MRACLFTSVFQSPPSPCSVCVRGVGKSGVLIGRTGAWPAAVKVAACCVQSDQFLRAVFKVASFCVLCSKWPVSACLRCGTFVVSGCCVGESHPPSVKLSDTILVMVGRWSSFTSVFTEVVSN